MGNLGTEWLAVQSPAAASGSSSTFNRRCDLSVLCGWLIFRDAVLRLARMVMSENTLSKVWVPNQRPWLQPTLPDLLKHIHRRALAIQLARPPIECCRAPRNL